MELDRFLRALVQRWYLLLLPTLVGLLSAYAYLQYQGAAAAVATVAVMEPAVTRGMTSPQAQVTFPAVAESYRVAARVVAKLGLTMEPSDLKDRVSVKLARSLVANVAAPLYRVTVEHPDAELARKLADAVVEEARQVFAELNALDAAQLDAAFRTQEEHLRAELEEARRVLRELEDQNQAWMLPSLLNAHLGILTSLQQGSYATASNRSANAALRTELQRNLAAAQAEQARLRGLQAEYARLQFDVALASTAVAQATGRLRDLALAGGPDLQGVAEQQATVAQTQLEAARAALAAFQRANAIGDLSADLMTQTAQISELRSRLIALAGEDGGPQRAIEAERQELSRLAALQPQHEELTARITSAQAKLGLLANRKLDLLITGMVAPISQVKTLDRAEIEPQVFWNIMVHLLGAVLGLFAGVMLVYLAAYFDRTPRTPGDVEELVGFPVLARLPKAQ